MVLGSRDLKHWVLGPSGRVSFLQGMSRMHEFLTRSVKPSLVLSLLRFVSFRRAYGMMQGVGCWAMP